MTQQSNSLSLVNQVWTTPKSIEEYRRRTEYIVVWTQVGVVSFLIALYLIAPTPQDAMNPVLYMAILIGYFLWLVAMIIATHRGPLSNALLWASTIIDFTALFALVWAIHMHYGQPPGFYLKAPTNTYIFIFLVLRVIRFEPQYVIGAGAMAVLGKLVLASYVQFIEGDAAVTGSFIDYMTNNALLWGAEIDQMMAIVIVTAVLTFTADRARVMLLHQINIAADLDQKRKTLQDAALTDSFTGLPNRHAAPDCLALASDAYSRPVGVLVIRIGDLSRTLTIFGYKFAGDIVSTVKDQLVACSKDDEQLLRLDDDSFLLIVTARTSEQLLAHRATQIIESFSKPLEINSRRVPVRLRIGISLFSPGGDPDEVLRCARTAVYSVKRDQIPPIAFFDEQMTQDAKRFLTIEHAMRTSLEEGTGFEPHYQTIVDIASGEIVGFEALVRWTLPGGEHISPVEFIPVAEATGMIVPLGRGVFQHAADDLARFNATRGAENRLFMSINVSIRQLQDPKFIDRIGYILAKLDYPAELIKVELTESLSAQEGENFSSKVEALRELGLKVAIDDFGTGYSSLSYLHSLPFTSLKIDQSFIRGLTAGSDRTALVQSIVDIADTLCLESIAEGIEDEATHLMVKEMGVQLGQGYHFAKPCCFEDALALLNSEAESETRCAD